MRIAPLVHFNFIGFGIWQDLELDCPFGNLRPGLSQSRLAQQTAHLLRSVPHTLKAEVHQCLPAAVWDFLHFLQVTSHVPLCPSQPKVHRLRLHIFHRRKIAHRCMRTVSTCVYESNVTT